MTIKKLLLICICFLVSFVILTTIFSDNGYLVNRSLVKRYEALKQKEELLEVQVASLSKQYESLDENSAMDDLALSLGYNREGEKVFYFQTPDEIEEQNKIVDEKLPEIYKGISMKIIFLISFGFSFFMALIILFLSRKKGSSETLTNEEGEKHYENYDFWFWWKKYRKNIPAFSWG